MVNFLQLGAGAVLRSVQSRLQDTVSVQDFGAVGDGVANDQPAIQAALNTGKSVYMPNGVYRVNAPVRLGVVGQRLYGESKQNTYLTTAAGSTHDILRVAAALCEVTGILFRPGAATNICVRIYAGWCYLHGNRFLSAVAHQGTAVVLTDQDPDAAFVAGAYTHRIEGNHFGASGYDFLRDIDDYSVQGITASKFTANQHFCDYPYRLSYGGGNVYYGNLYQSATGTAGTKVGTCLDFGLNVYGEVVHGNYFELYTTAVLSRATSNAYQSFRATENHFDNNGATPVVASATNYFFDDSVANIETKNGWSDNYSGATRVFKGPAGNPLLTLDSTGVTATTVRRNSVPTTMTYSADAQTQNPASEYVLITGAGAQRSNCVLGKAGAVDGQRLVVVGLSWSVVLTNTNLRLSGGAATVTVGGTAGYVQSIEFMFSAAYGQWIEINRVIY